MPLDRAKIAGIIKIQEALHQQSVLTTEQSVLLTARVPVSYTHLQDYLRLGAEARMNEPGTLKPQNWRWRLVPGQLTDALAEKIARLTNAAKRV